VFGYGRVFETGRRREQSAATTALVDSALAASGLTRSQEPACTATRSQNTAGSAGALLLVQTSAFSQPKYEPVANVVRVTAMPPSGRSGPLTTSCLSDCLPVATVATCPTAKT